MKVYTPGARGKQIMFVEPGREFPVSEFVDEHGKAKQFQIPFVNGEASVDDQIGQYMLDKGIAKRSPLILPQGVA